MKCEEKRKLLPLLLELSSCYSAFSTGCFFLLYFFIQPGHRPEALAGPRTGFYWGFCFIEPHLDFDDPIKCPNLPRSLFTRVPLHFGFKGPVLRTDTACNSSLCAFDEAFNAIKVGLIDRAIVVGTNDCYRPYNSLCFKDLTMINKDGRCKGLDASADGYCRSEAIVVTLLERRDLAKRIYATVVACKSNSDGYKEEGITFPSMDSQRKLIEQVYSEAQINPADIGYIEAHLTGTAAGDPVEMQAICDVICQNKKDPLLVGCLKASIGHSEGASGLCSLAKAVVILQTKLIPPNLYFYKANPNIKPLVEGKIAPVLKVTPLPGELIPLNNFGFGGSNTHLLIKGFYPPSSSCKEEEKFFFSEISRIVPLCGRTRASLDAMYHKFKSDSRFINEYFIDLLYTFSSESRMAFRSFILINGSSRGKFSLDYFTAVKEEEEEENVTQSPVKAIVVYFTGNCPGIKDGCMRINCFKAAIDQIGLLVRDTLYSKSLSSVICQLAWAVTFKSIGLLPEATFGCNFGAFAAAFLDSVIDLKNAVLCAVKASQYNDEKRSYHQLRSDFLSITGSIEASDRLLEMFFSPDCQYDLPISINNNDHQVIYPDSLTASSFIQLLGHLYLRGHNFHWPHLYPSVTYPFPSTTPSLSSLVAWKHEKTFPIAPFLIKEKIITLSGYYKYTFNAKNAEDRFLFDHIIDEKILFPATGYLMLAWDTLARITGQCIWDHPIHFSDVKFIRATVLDPLNDNEFSVRINYDTGRFFILQSEMEVVTGSVTFANDEPSVSTCVDSNTNTGSNRTSNLLHGNANVHANGDEKEDGDDIELNCQQIYREMRVRGYDYGPYFQCLSRAKADGSKGVFIWRNVTPKMPGSISVGTAGPNSNGGNEFSESGEARNWLRNWAVLVDTAFQLDVLRDSDNSRSLFIPTKVESIICFPTSLKRQIDFSDKFTDALSQSDAALVKFERTADSVVWTPGLYVKGLKTTLLRRRPQQVNKAQVQFVPCDLKQVLTGASKHLIDSYVKACHTRSNPNEMFDLNEGRFCLLRSAILSQPVTEASDILFGPSFTDFHFRKSLLYPHLETVVNNLPIADGCNGALSALELYSDGFVLGKTILDFWNEIVLCDVIKVTYSLFHVGGGPPEGEEEKMHQSVGNIPSGVQMVTSLSETATQNLLIAKCDSVASLMDCLALAKSKLHEGAFLLISYCDEPDSSVALHLMKNLSTRVNIMNRETVHQITSNAGFTWIQTTALDEHSTLRTALFRFVPFARANASNKTIHQIGLHDYQALEQLRQMLTCSSSSPSPSASTAGSSKTCHSQLDKREQIETIWLVPKSDDVVKGVTGIYGLVKTLRLEPNGHKLRCIIDFSASASINLDEEKYKEIVAKDLVFNVFDGDSNSWGAYQVVVSDDESSFSSSSPPSSPPEGRITFGREDFYLRCLKPGDLSSLTWVLAGPRRHLIASASNTLSIKVAFSALNFRDIMFATGQLDFDAIPGISSSISQDSILGLEVSGINPNTNERVMAITPYQGIASTASFVDPLFTWSVPKQWTLEEAATVPVVYATAYYALIIRGNLTQGESVLIHSAAGGVGLAAMAICISMNCQVFATVGSSDKVKYLLSKYPSMAHRIFNSRTIDFADEILTATNGKGVDVILNSLSEEKLQASLTCLAPNGRFLELGKVDFVKDHKLFIHQMIHNKSFHGVLLDALFNYGSGALPYKIQGEKEHLNLLIQRGIEDGVVKPLDRTVFPFDQVESAFRFMAGGKHVGKVILKMNLDTSHSSSSNSSSLDASSSPSSPCSSCPSSASPFNSHQLSPVAVTYCDPDKVYIVLGGLGGFGLEFGNWLVSRGAKKLLLTSRKGIRDSYQRYSLNRIKSKGCFVKVVTHDASSELAAKTLLEEANLLATVGGIFNFAVVYEDKLFQDTTGDSFNKVCAPKSLASLHLDKWSRILCPQLDYFVTISSLSAGRGNPGQTAYNFANFTLESLSMARHRQGLPALSVEWGVIGDTGIVAEMSQSNDMVLLGTRAQRLHSCFDTLDEFLSQNSPVRISYIRNVECNSKKHSGDTHNLISIMSRLLGIKDLSTLDPEVTLAGLGVDSLIAVEIKQTLDKVFSKQFSMKEVRGLKIRDLLNFSPSSSPSDEK